MEKQRILYKYREDSEFTEKILTDKTVWLSRPENLNDPFECSIANFTEKAKTDFIEKIQNFQIAGFVTFGVMYMKNKRVFFGMSGKTLKHFLKRLRTKNNVKRYQLINDVIYRASGKWLSNPRDLIRSLENRLAGIGIFSLSETDTNQLMWAHYGKESRGIALGFEVSESSRLADEKHCIPVNYTDEIPRFDDELTTQLSYSSAKERPDLSVPFDDPKLRACVATKPTVWEYEKEWRYIDETDGLHPHPGRLVEITFGLRCPAEVRNKYVALAAKHFDYPIRFYEIIKKTDSNQIEKIEFLPQ